MSDTINMDPKAAAELLKKYEFAGESHGSYIKLKEGLEHKQEEQVKQALKELEELRNNPPKTPKVELAPPKPKTKFPVWNILWIILLGLGLSLGPLLYTNAHIRDLIRAAMPPQDEVVASQSLGGLDSGEIAVKICKELQDIAPENVMFVGHQLVKKEVVEYLSAISAKSRVRIIIGADATGQSPLADPNCPLRQFYFTELRETSTPIRSQVLIAVNSQTKRAVAYFGTFPYDKQDAASGEHMLVVIRNYSTCGRLYTYYNTLFPQPSQTPRR